MPPWITASSQTFEWMSAFTLELSHAVDLSILKSHPKEVPQWDHFRSYLYLKQSQTIWPFWHIKRHEIQRSHIMPYHAISSNLPSHIIKLSLLIKSPKGSKRTMSRHRVFHNESMAGSRRHNLEAQQPWPLPMLLRWEPYHRLPGFPKSQQSRNGCTDSSTRWLE